jgi:HSP20 family protein
MSTVPQKQETQVAAAPEKRTLTPRVDIFEVEDGLGVVLDMPGVTKESIEVHVENDVLTIAGKACTSLPDTVLYREHELGKYFRQFQLTEHVDQEKIKADYKCGVLTVHLPKGEKAKPKQIKVNVTS